MNYKQIAIIGALIVIASVSVFLVINENYFCETEETVTDYRTHDTEEDYYEDDADFLKKENEILKKELVKLQDP